jgi:hypothetical protein
MSRNFTKAFASLMLFASFTLSAHGQFTATKRSSADAGINIVNAPVPSPLLSGKKAFVSYELGDVTAFPEAYSGGPERAYGEFYAAMKSWGHYDLVADPSQADVIFTVRFTDSVGTIPQIRIGILDAKTHFALWGFVEQVDFKFRKKNRDLAFTDSVKLLVTDIQTLIGQSTVPPPPAQP